MAAAQQAFTYEEKENIAFVTLGNPQSLVFFDRHVFEDLTACFLAIENNPEIAAVILSGVGKAFAAGSDIAQVAALPPEEGRSFSQCGHTCMNLIEALPVPVIAAVNGYALGGGFELALACDIRIASEQARFGLPEVNLGIALGYGSSQRLPRLVGMGMAKYLSFTCEVIDAQEALRIGLVEKVTTAEDLLPFCLSLAESIRAKSRIAIRMAKSAILESANQGMKDGLLYETETFACAFADADRVEGMRAFLEKRKPGFTSR
ncbi:MAG: enoyl-CoA hydratase-related protein [Clostridiales bacterium]|nr:enoyl-CoA hydratase-related protein [Clostridiales bacterium]